METNKVKDKDIQLVIGYLLRYGIWTALTVTATGGILYLWRHHGQIVDYGTFSERDVNIFRLISQMCAGVAHGIARDIMLLGIILLFLTPVLRILFSLVAFFLEKDYLYVMITLIVVAIICFSIFFGFAH